MTSKRRIRRKMCSGKRRHATREEALAHAGALYKLGRTGGGSVAPYPCQFCNGYHVGHRKPYREAR